jgi:hypothetical protein
MILHEKTKSEFGYDFETASNRSLFHCVCDYCGKEFDRIKRTIVQCNGVITKDSCGIGSCKKQKSEDVQIAKYGVPNVGGDSERTAKKKQTCLERYGAEHYINSEQSKKENVEKWGHECYASTEEFKDRVKATRIETYGVDHHMKNQEFKKERQGKLLSKYGVDHYSKTKEFSDKVRATFLEKYGVEWYFQSDEFYLSQIDKVPNSRFGKTQKEITDFVNALGYNFASDRTILSGKEIDLLDGKMGFEYCGLYFHNEMSPQPRTRRYHYDKYKKCLDKGIRLTTIFEDEWKHKNAQCKSIIKSMLGKPDFNIFGRKCTVSEIESPVFHQFCNEYHMRGSCRNVSVAFGLFFEGELVGAMSLGKHHRGVEGVVLNRLCFKGGYAVIGGSSKLFSRCVEWCVKNGKSTILSWSDNRWSAGGVYKALGFDLDGEMPPDYSYVLAKGGSLTRLSKQSCNKKRIGCGEGDSERTHMLKLGYARIWDCGKKRWVMKV